MSITESHLRKARKALLKSHPKIPGVPSGKARCSECQQGYQYMVYGGIGHRSDAFCHGHEMASMSTRQERCGQGRKLVVRRSDNELFIYPIDPDERLETCELLFKLGVRDGISGLHSEDSDHEIAWGGDYLRGYLHGKALLAAKAADIYWKERARPSQPRGTRPRSRA